MLLNPSFVNQYCTSCHYETTITNNNLSLIVIENRARYNLPTAQIYFILNGLLYEFELCTSYEFYQEHNVPDEKDYDLLLSHIKHRFLGIGAYNPDVKVRIKPVGKRVIPSILR